MRRLSLRGTAGSWRARRWDVLILGSALPGWFAAARLGSLGLRVLIVEEDAPNREFPLLNEPFFSSCPSGGPLDEALKACGVTPVDRRGLESSPVTYQVLLDEARIDIGHPNATVDDLVAYGVAKPDEARALMRELDDAVKGQSRALLTGNWVRASSRRGAGRSSASPQLPPAPGALRTLSPDLAAFVSAQIDAQSLIQLAGQESDARHLCAGLGGGVYFGRPGTSLLGLLQKRVERVHGEVRRLSGSFELVEVGGHPGIALRASGEAWLGRALVINTPVPNVMRALEDWGSTLPRGFEDGPLGPQQVAVIFQGDAELFPEALAARSILATRRAPVPLALSLFPSERAPGATLLHARGLFPADAETGPIADEIEGAIRDFFPFCEDRLERVAYSRPSVWDTPGAIEQTPDTPRLPAATELRIPGKLPVFALRRGRLGGLGVEGDALLGWRGADAVAPTP